MSNVCLFCNNPDTLNTSMTITLEDNTKVNVVICDKCADDATPKKAREAYHSKQKQIEDVMAQARALGLDLSTTTPNSQLVIMQKQASTPTTIPTITPAPPETTSPLIDDEEGPVIPTSKMFKPMRSVGGSASLGDISTNVQSHSSHSLDTPDAQVLQGKAKVTMVEGRAGMPIQLPALIHDGTGTTRVRVRQSMDDAKLQRKFKSMGSESRWDRGPDFRGGYDKESERPCPICNGSGQTRNLGKMVSCPKCDGTGILVI